MQSVAIYKKQLKHPLNCLFSVVVIDNIYIFDGYRGLLQPGHSATVTWTAIIQAHTSHGQQQKALQLFEDMQRHGIAPNEYTYSCILSAINSISLVTGHSIHAHLMVIEVFAIPIFTFDRRNIEILSMFQWLW
jgi:pentatricopeptide repeat protein